MKTVLVHYKQSVEAKHSMVDDWRIDASKVVEVAKLTDLNNMFRHIIKIDILQ